MSVSWSAVEQYWFRNSEPGDPSQPFSLRGDPSPARRVPSRNGPSRSVFAAGRPCSLLFVHRVAEDCADYAAYNVCHVGDVVLNEDTVVDLLAKIDNGNKYERDGDLSLLKARE